MSITFICRVIWKFTWHLFLTICLQYIGPRIWVNQLQIGNMLSKQLKTKCHYFMVNWKTIYGWSTFLVTPNTCKYKKCYPKINFSWIKQSKWNNNKRIIVGEIFLHLTHGKKHCLCYIYTLWHIFWEDHNLY